MKDWPPFSSRMLAAGNFPFAPFENRKAALRAKGVRLFDFGVGDPVEPTPEFIRLALSAHVPMISRYPSPTGIPELRCAIAEYLMRRFGARLDPETEILPTLGSKEAIFNLAFLFGGNGAARNIMIGPAPGYFVVEKSAVMSGMEYYPYPLKSAEGYLMDLGSLPSSLLNKTAVAWINYPHNPTGAECSLDYLRRQVETAHKFGFVLCSDECYCDIYYGSPPPGILQVTKEGVLAFHSCSKRSGMTAYRSGFVAGDTEIIRRFRSYRNIIGTAPPIFIQWAAQAAWSDDEHAAERRTIFSTKREVMLKFFKDHGFEVHPSLATFYFWVKAPEGSAQEYAEALMERGLIVSPGDFFGACDSSHFRVALAPSLEECREAVRVWSKIESRRRGG